MLRSIQLHFQTFLKQKTALPVIFILLMSMANFLITGDFSQSASLPATKAQASLLASGTSLVIYQAALKDTGQDSIVDQRQVSIYSKFLDTNFITPILGKNWGVLHGNNNSAVDFANACGTKIHAADDGLVVELKANNGWNGGYGNYVVLEHANGERTKYAHARKISVKKGDYVLQGDVLGEVGNTGLVVVGKNGNGCHLHFEVENGKNPFANY